MLADHVALLEPEGRRLSLQWNIDYFSPSSPQSLCSLLAASSLSPATRAHALRSNVELTAAVYSEAQLAGCLLLWPVHVTVLADAHISVMSPAHTCLVLQCGRNAVSAAYAMTLQAFDMGDRCASVLQLQHAQQVF